MLDEGVPDSVGKVLRSAGHRVTYLNQTLLRGSRDQLVVAYAVLNQSILVAIDGDMRQIARGHGISKTGYRQLSLLKLSCREPLAARRVTECLSLIEHEWHFSSLDKDRRLFIDIGDSVIRTHR